MSHGSCSFGRRSARAHAHDESDAPRHRGSPQKRKARLTGGPLQSGSPRWTCFELGLRSRRWPRNSHPRHASRVPLRPVAVRQPGISHRKRPVDTTGLRERKGLRDALVTAAGRKDEAGMEAAVNEHGDLGLWPREVRLSWEGLACANRSSPLFERGRPAAAPSFSFRCHAQERLPDHGTGPRRSCAPVGRFPAGRPSSPHSFREWRACEAPGTFMLANLA